MAATLTVIAVACFIVLPAIALFPVDKPRWGREGPACEYRGVWYMGVGSASMCPRGSEKHLTRDSGLYWITVRSCVLAANDNLAFLWTIDAGSVAVLSVNRSTIVPTGSGSFSVQRRREPDLYWLFDSPLVVLVSAIPESFEKA